MAKRGREDRFASQCAAIRLWHRRSGVFTGCVKTDCEAAAGKKSALRSSSCAGKGALQGKGGGQFPHPPLERQSEGRGAYYVLTLDVLEW
jgi:hypothetical protein